MQVVCQGEAELEHWPVAEHGHSSSELVQALESFHLHVLNHWQQRPVAMEHRLTEKRKQDDETEYTSRWEKDVQTYYITILFR